jgi:hypothetical protein
MSMTSFQTEDAMCHSRFPAGSSTEIATKPSVHTDSGVSCKALCLTFAPFVNLNYPRVDITYVYKSHKQTRDPSNFAVDRLALQSDHVSKSDPVGLCSYRVSS